MKIVVFPCAICPKLGAELLDSWFDQLALPAAVWQEGVVGRDGATLVEQPEEAGRAEVGKGSPTRGRNAEVDVDQAIIDRHNSVEAFAKH